jgi:RimJ/RimL family protein N-acetyltransferase
MMFVVTTVWYNSHMFTFERTDDNNPQHVKALQYHLESPSVLNTHLIQIPQDMSMKYIAYTDKYLVFNIQEENKTITVGICKIADYSYNQLDSVIISYTILPEYQGQGLGTQLVKNLIEYIPQQYPKAKHIFATVMDGNIASERILLKNNFVPATKIVVKQSVKNQPNSTAEKILSMVDLDASEQIKEFYRPVYL